MSKRRQAGLVMMCLLLAVFFVWLDHSPIKRKWQPQPRDLEKYHGKTFTVVNVVDGDTLDIDVPNSHYPHTRIRLWGVDTPETKKPNTPVQYFGPEATKFTTTLTLGKTVTIYLDEGNRTRDNKEYNRLLGYVKLPDGRFLNEVLVSGGFAYADLRFRHSFYNKYKQLEAAARSQKKGLWENVIPEQMPQWRSEF
jgi:micrococcal nuclease